MSKVWSSFQQAIFEDFKLGKGAVAIDACPGAGKSTTLIEGLNHLPKGASDIMMTSFSTQSVDDLKKKEPPWFVDVRTMNSLGNRAITDHFGRQNLNKERVFGLLDQVLGERPTSPELRTQFNGFRARIKALVDMAKSYLVETPTELLELGDLFEMDTTTPGWIAVELAKQFGCEQEDVLMVSAHRVLQLCKEVKGNIDYNDQIWLPFVHQLPLETFQYVIVDEAQDTSLAQMDLLVRSCSPKGGRIILAGEDAQAIYAWRGAGLGMAPFIKRTNARILPLSISYRCPKSIVRQAAKVVPGIQAAPEAPEGSVSSLPLDMLPNEIGIGDTILSRKNAPLIALFMELLSQKFPVAMQGRNIGEKLLKFVRKSEAKTVDELLDYTNMWGETERKRRTDKNPKAKVDHIADHVRCVEVLCEGKLYVSDVVRGIELLLRAPDEGTILLSTVHRAKGLEWDRVFLLHDTFPVHPTFWLKYANRRNANKWAEEKAAYVMQTEVEEKNILYVAITRAKRELIYVMPINRSPGEDT